MDQLESVDCCYCTVQFDHNNLDQLLGIPLFCCQGLVNQSIHYILLIPNNNGIGVVVDLIHNDAKPRELLDQQTTNGHTDLLIFNLLTSIHCLCHLQKLVYLLHQTYTRLAVTADLDVFIDACRRLATPVSKVRNELIIVSDCHN